MVFALVSAVVFESHAAPGELDPAFGAGGISRIPVQLRQSTQVRATARQADGKIIVAGDANSSLSPIPGMPPSPKLAVVGRFNADGSIDTSFGIDGWTIIDPVDPSLGPGSSAVSVAPTSQGNVLVGLNYDLNGSSFVVRLDATGRRDLNFPALRILTAPIAALAAGFDGGFVTVSAGGLVLHRFDAQGMPDFAFGNGGQKDIDVAGGGAVVRTVRLNDDGSVLLGGWYDPTGTNRNMLVLKLTANGSFDPQFRNGGILTLDYSGKRDEVTVLEDDGQGGVIAAGRTAVFNNDSDATFALFRFDATTGALDLTFGNVGRASFVTVGGNYIAEPTGLLVAPDGTYYVAGTASQWVGPVTRSVLAHIDAAGRPIAQFGVGGVFSSPEPSDFTSPFDRFAGIALHDGIVQAIGGRLVAVDPFGSIRRGFTLSQQFSAVDGASVGETRTGQAVSPIGAIAVKAAMLPDGRSVLIGSFGDFARVTRLLADGSLDTSFQDGGHFDFQIAGNPTAGAAITVDATENIVVGSVVTSTFNPFGQWSVSRWTSDGFPDPSFAGGNVFIGTTGFNASFSGVAVQADGKVIASGASNDSGWAGRLNPDGSPDASFGGFGGVTTFFTGPGLTATAMAVQPDGAVLVAANQVNFGVINPVIQRFTPSGQVDFGWLGSFLRVPPSLRSFSVSALALQPDGKVLVGGTGFGSDGQPQTTIFRLTADGNPDSQSFGERFPGVAIDSASLGAANLTGIGVTGDGRIMVGGDFDVGYPFAYRLNGDGTLDATYGTGGSTRLPGLKSGDWVANVIDGIGTVRLMGYETTSAGVDQLLLVQLQGQSDDSDPDPFQFTDVVNVPVSTWVVSEPVTISGITVSVPISVEFGEYSIGCTGNFTREPGVISNGQTVCVRVMSSDSGSSGTHARLTVGSLQAVFNVQTGVVPDTSITSAPPPAVASTTATFEFASSVPASTFVCSIDGKPATACTSPATYSSLVEGSHVFWVQAVNSIGSDLSPAVHQWVVDLTAPETTISSGPDSKDKVDYATFTFSSNEAGATFECRFDGGTFMPCASPLSYTNLPSGDHTLRVRARDRAGNVDGSPAIWEWKSR